MSRPHQYIALVASLPHLGKLFSRKDVPVSEFRLKQRLSMLEPDHARLLREVVEITAWAGGARYERDIDVIRRAKAVMADLNGYPDLQHLVVARMETRTLIAALRHRRDGQESAGDIGTWGLGRWCGRIRVNWNDPSFGLGHFMPWVSEAHRLLQQGDHIAMERLVLTEVSRQLGHYGTLHEFDFEAVVIYVLRWVIVERWSRYNEADARARLETLVAQALGDAPVPGRTGPDIGQIHSFRGNPVMTSHVQLPEPTAEIVAVQDDLVTLSPLGDAPLIKNEVVYIIPHGPERDGRPREYLKAEVLRVRGRSAEAQVFESTSGVCVGDKVIQSGEMLSVALGPGLLSTVFDGLQNPLADMAAEYRFFLPRGVLTNALDQTRKWSFEPKVKSGDAVKAGDTLGTVPEGRFEHRIMAPFGLTGTWTVDRIREGTFTINEVVATLKNDRGETRDLTLVQHWPVRRAIPEGLVKAGRSERLYPSEPLITTLRLIDTFFPIARGGMGCIPGPFGADKTVLQSLISRFSAVNIVIVVACGERAGEVVETITEFPHQPDPSGDGTLMDRTVIICNTSSMPVAAREASIYTGITLGEYYRQMG